MSNDPAGPDELTGQPPYPADRSSVAPPPRDDDASSHPTPDGFAFAAPAASETPAHLDLPAEARPEVSEAPAFSEPATPASDTPVFGDLAAPAGDVWPPAEPVDPYVDVPASLELSYTAADVGLSPNAYDRAYPYEVIQKKRRRTAGTRVRKVGRELAETVILALLIFFAVKAVVQNFRVEGASMEPSMHNDQYLLVNKALYFRFNVDRIHDFLPFIPSTGDGGQHHLFRPPRRGDVVVFKFPLDPNRDFIKRVIGVPGDTVEVRDETVFINGSPLKESYIKDKPNYTYAPKTVPPGMYYVLGDNRRNSFDSHAWGNSCSPQQLCDFVPEENIIGQAWVTYWPFDELGFINNKILKPQAP